MSNYILRLSLLIAVQIGVFGLSNAQHTMASERVVYTSGPQKEKDVSHLYFTRLMKLALEHPQFGGKPVSIRYISRAGHDRAMKFLQQGETYDVLWSGERLDETENLHKINIPLMFGGLGWRGMVVREEDAKAFSSKRIVGDFKRQIACQGQGWPDADILSGAGFRVLQISDFDSMYQLLTNGRCDFIPLSIFEGAAELDAVSERFGSLVFIKTPIIRYALTMNFYVAPDEKALADELSKGLQHMFDSGELEAFAKAQPLTRDAFPLSQYRHFIDL